MTDSRPILFSGPMVRAILAGTKTQTRRVLNPQPRAGVGLVEPEMLDAPGIYRTWLDLRSEGKTAHEHDFNAQVWRCPYGVPGDRLWVRETWAKARASMRPPLEGYPTYRVPGGAVGVVRYRAEDGLIVGSAWRWKPSIHMPRWASRITLEVVKVRVERVQEITGDDAMREGAEFCDEKGHDDCFYGGALQGYRCSFERLWDQINGGRGWWWRLNPWVWVVEFKKVEQEQGG